MAYRAKIHLPFWDTPHGSQNLCCLSEQLSLHCLEYQHYSIIILVVWPHRNPYYKYTSHQYSQLHMQHYYYTGEQMSSPPIQSNNCIHPLLGLWWLIKEGLDWEWTGTGLSIDSSESVRGWQKLETMWNSASFWWKTALIKTAIDIQTANIT